MNEDAPVFAQGVDQVLPFALDSGPCPKCRGTTRVDRYLYGGNPIRDERGRFLSVTMKPEEHLVVCCVRCGYEQLMETA